MKILVAEDNSFYRHMLVSTLTEWGYEVVAAVERHRGVGTLQGSAPPNSRSSTG